MRKKIKLIFLSIGLSIVLIAGIIELGKILNVVSTQETSQGFKETVVTAAPRAGHTEGSLSGANCSTMYNFAPGYYCARHEWEIARHMSHDASTVVISDPAGGGRAQEIKYKYEKTTEMTQSIAYARNYTVNGQKTSDYEMQRIIWGSWQFKAYTGGDCGLLEDVKQDGTWTTTSLNMRGRSYQFANFIYKALDEQGHLNMTCTPLTDEDDSLRIMVDQTALQYTVGPYVLNFERQEEGCVEGTGNELMKDLVYNEITEKNQCWSEDNKFCTGKVQALITYEDNTHELKEIGVEVLDESGNPIEENFPRFGETFYLRYKTTLDEDIRYIRPSIQISHLKKMTNNGKNYEVYTYKSEHIKYSMITDQGEIIDRSFSEMALTAFYGGLYIDARAQAIGDEWYVRFQQNADLIGRDAGEKISHVVSVMMDRLREEIIQRGQSWGLGNVDADIGCIPKVYWRGNYYDPDMYIDAEFVTRIWERTVEDELTGESHTESEESVDKPDGEGWSVEKELWRAFLVNAPSGLEDISITDERSDAMWAVQDEIRSRRWIKISICTK